MTINSIFFCLVVSTVFRYECFLNDGSILTGSKFLNVFFVLLWKLNKWRVHIWFCTYPLFVVIVGKLSIIVDYNDLDTRNDKNFQIDIFGILLFVYDCVVDFQLHRRLGLVQKITNKLQHLEFLLCKSQVSLTCFAFWISLFVCQVHDGWCYLNSNQFCGWEIM